MAMTQQQLEYQREYRKRTGNIAQKRYYEANKQVYLEAGRKWRKANPEKVAATQKAWREANPEKVTALAKAWREANPLKVKKSLKRAQAKRASNLSAFASHAFSVIKNRAKKDGRGLKITANYLETLLKEANGKCQVTGLPLSYKIGDMHKASFDRIDNNKGYVYGNLQVVSSYINYAKQEHPQDVLFEVAKAIVQHNGL